MATVTAKAGFICRKSTPIASDKAFSLDNFLDICFGQ